MFKLVLIEIRPSIINGVGVFAIQGIEKEKFIAEGIHKNDYKDLIPWENYDCLDSSIKKKIMDFCIGTAKGFFPPKDYDFNKLSIEWSMNHSCNGNIGFNEKGDFISIRDIKKNEELTYDYGLAESNTQFNMQCNCGCSNCRKIITGNDWKNLDFRNKYLRYMLPLLRNNF